MLIETGFNIYIFFSYLADVIDIESDWLDYEEKKLLELF